MATGVRVLSFTAAQLPPLRIVRQEDADGCGVASLAMVMGITYQGAKALFHPYLLHHERFHGFPLNDLLRVLAEHGYAAAVRYRHHHGLCCELSDWPPAPWAERHLCEVRPLGGGPGFHSVVLAADGRVYDPGGHGIIESLACYPKVTQVAAVYRVHPGPITGAILDPHDSRRCRPDVCGCAAAWEAA